jgi:hypothetical protein
VIEREILARLARETGVLLSELGARSSDRAWIARHAETVASLGRISVPRRSVAKRLYRLARRAARTAR